MNNTDEHDDAEAGPELGKTGFVRALGDGILPVKSRGKASVGGLGTKSPEAGDLLHANYTTMKYSLKENKTILDS